jgi:hypothetical protein
LKYHISEGVSHKPTGKGDTEVRGREPVTQGNYHSEDNSSTQGCLNDYYLVDLVYKDLVIEVTFLLV